MCSVRSVLVLAMLLLAASFETSKLAGQAPRPEDLERRIDSLLPIRNHALARAEVADSLASLRKLREGAARTDTFHVGNLTVVALAGQVDQARQVMETAWDRYEPFLGPGDAELFDGHFFAFQLHHGIRRKIVVEAPSDRIHDVQINAFWGRRRLDEKAAAAVSRVLSSALDPDIREWGGLLAPGDLRAATWLYRTMVATPSLAVRECRAGDVPMCWKAFGLTGSGTAGERWRDLYTSQDRREIVRTSGRPSAYGSRGREDILLYDRCLEEADGEACLGLLRSKLGEDPIPLSYAARSALLVFAIEKGGGGAFARLNDSEGTIRDRLSAAASMDPDELMSAWLEEVREARPKHAEGELATRWSTLFWVLVLGFLATRSTRWRSD